MVFMIINFIVGAGLMAFAFTSDHVASGQKEYTSITNHILMLSCVFILMGASMLLCYFAPRFLCLLVGRVTFVLIAWFCTGFCTAIIAYKSNKPHRFLTVVQWILNVVAFGVIFMSGKAVTGVENGVNGYLHVISSVITYVDGPIRDVTWIDAYLVFYIGLVQFTSLLMGLIRAEHSRNKLMKQGMIAIGLGFVATWITFVLIRIGASYQTGFSSLIILSLAPELLAFVYAASNDSIWGKTLIKRTILRVVFLYIVPACLVGLSFLIIYRSTNDRGTVFYVACTIACAAIYGLWFFISNRLSKTDLMRDGKYEKRFESAITSINFDEQSKDIESEINSAFRKYVGTSTVRMAIDAGTGFLETINDDDGEEKITVPIDQKGFDVLLNIKHSIVFKSFIEKDYQVKDVKEPLLEMMEATKSDAFILLNEGRRIVGVLFLGQKVSGDVYNSYDYKVFSKLYSTFFVVGFYMKNMMNESVVGTVNREIRMSSQIITSIQENMDYISNPKLDCGYRMVPAHNIGGEFIDMIRLNETRHMFVIGALSGKGIAASMSMVILKSVIRTNLAETKDFKLLVEKTNSFIRTGLPKGTFFSGMFGIIDFSTDTLYYINCGAPALFMYNRLYNNVIEIQGEGHVLGFAKDISNLIRVKKVKMSAGDIILACTDGLIESKSLRGESYGKTRVQSQIMENATYPADKMGQFIYDNLLSFSSKALEDDYTVLIIKQME